MGSRQFLTVAASCILFNLSPNVGDAQTERPMDATARVSTQCWVLLDSDEFKERLRAISNSGQMASAAETRSLLAEAERAGQVIVLAQRELTSADQAAAKFSSLVEVPATPGNSIEPARDRNVLIELSLTPQAQPSGDLLLSFNVQLRPVVRTLPIGAASRLEGPRSVVSKVLLEPGEAHLLNLSSNDPAAMTDPAGVKGRDLLLVLAPRIIDDAVRR